MVADDEQVARIVSHEWVIDGELQLAAFALAPRETYLSVNRDNHTKSHAGIFVRVNGKNVVHGRLLPEGQLPYNVSEEYLLQQVQWDLLELAELQECRVSSE